MERWQNKVAVITGASSGIGVAIAKDFVMAGLQVIGLARRKELMEKLHNDLPEDKRSQFTPMYCDISSRESINEVFANILSQFGAIDVLVNNAGCMKLGQLSSMKMDDVEKVLHTNVLGLVACTQFAFKSMKERNFNGHIINVNSIAGHSVLLGIPNQTPAFNIYSPTKYAITAINEIYRTEFRDLKTQIKISSISPGFVDTEIIYDDLRKVLGECLLKPEDVSNAVMFTLSTPPHVQVHDMIIKPVGEIV
ncbi:farnesol dehydrogenase-like [Musca vetustissima]|uniref:farnesol dehydrogenase-like n=1 Tax=Musca vetustissima TaxID=27455 RepID=UPI002AB712A1|nr:farnesol dehydrogenase-like [Musca vetustissima]